MSVASNLRRLDAQLFLLDLVFHLGLSLLERHLALAQRKLSGLAIGLGLQLSAHLDAVHLGLKRQFFALKLKLLALDLDLRLDQLNIRVRLRRGP